ncbi:glycosyltransferase family 4 protein [Cumulibacter manganitolerans]|uniref:glycosyltransferase family 4 protein n=1 Tax=Cumulibacter manganitolerans TaxID=1884992 RepID=UPI001E61CDC0|nr:glycosyltransferase family 4 protein [Cumulibacter manganitolerans]
MTERPLRIGMVSPYSWDVPGGVQFHIRDLAETLIGQGHHVSVLTPVQRAVDLPPYVVDAGRAVPIRYNGSVARIQFGVVSGARARSWLTQGRFDVVHVHEPQTLSLSLIACMMATCPIVATVHAATERSRTLAALQAPLQPFLERIAGRIAVSELARRLQVEHLGGDAVLIPNGVFVDRFATAEPLPQLRDGAPTIGFLGRYDEPRKGLQVLIPAVRRLVAELPDVRLAIAGRGDDNQLRAELPLELSDNVEILGPLSEQEKQRFLRSLDAYCAPNTGGESFGIILTEAMAAGAPVVASDIDAFRRVLDDGRAGLLTPVGDSDALAAGLWSALCDRSATEQRRARATEVVRQYDWSVVARRVLGVYRTVIGG